jgi:hypothetical protein
VENFFLTELKSFFLIAILLNINYAWYHNDTTHNVFSLLER